MLKNTSGQHCGKQKNFFGKFFCQRLLTGLILFLVIGGIISFGLLSQIFQGTAQEEPPLFVKEERIEKPRPLFVPGELIIKFKEEVTEKEIDGLEIEQEAEEEYESPFTHARRWKISPIKTGEEWEDFFDRHPLVEYAEPNYLAYATMIPNDPYYPRQWHLDNPTYGGIQMEQAWDRTAGTSSIVVAVVDTGIAYENYPAPAHCHIDTYKAYSGNSWWCGATTTAWATEPGYGNGWKDYLEHSFNLTIATGTVTLTYQYRHDLEVTAGVAYDKAFTEISTDGGTSWTTLKTYTGKSRVAGQVAWKSEFLNLTSYIGNNVLVRFRVFSDESYSDEDGLFNSDGAFFVDEIKLEDTSGTLFYDDVESGPGTWETTKYQKAPDLAGTSFVAGYDFINNDAHANDDEGHGTHVAGTVAQTTNNNLGVAGIAFNTTLMPVKVLSAAGSGTYQQVADGIYYAVNNGAKVINMSLGGSSPSAVLENAVAYAYNNGVTVIAACGNSNASSCDYPAGYNSFVIAVGATRYNETKAPYSNYGSSLDIVAPGGDTSVDQNADGYPDGVLQNTFGDTPVDFAYWFYQGTSMATPHVSGVAALILGLRPNFTPAEVRNTLQSTAEDKGSAGWDSTYGWGIVDAQVALLSIPAVSITLLTDGNTPFGVVPLNTAIDTTPAGTNDVQTVRVDMGPANLDIKTTLFSDGTNNWALGTINGDNQVVWEYSKEGVSWNKFLAANTLHSLAPNVPQPGTQDIYFRLAMPTITVSSAQYSSVVTVVATAP